MNVHFETGRLTIRDLKVTDVEGMFQLDSDIDVHKYLGTKPVKTKQQAKDIITYIREQYKTNGVGRLAIIDKLTNDFVGWTGLKLEDEVRKEFNYYDIGYRLIKKYWDKGIATEAGIASLKFGFEQLNLTEICGAAHTENIASNKVLQKIGLSFIETFEFENVLHNWYKIKKADWTKIQ